MLLILSRAALRFNARPAAGYNDRVSWEIIGHEWAAALLRRHIAESMVRHAYLITGAAGLGKRTLCLRFAQALNCTQAEHAGDRCGRDDCRACRLTPLETYPDLHVVASDGATKIDDVRQLQAQLALAPYEGGWRVALLTDFHRATLNAANALLKTLEEPPSKVVLLLTAADPDLLPATVVSRCEQLRLKGVGRQEIASALRDRGAAADQAEQLAMLSGGRPGRALALLEAPEELEQRERAIGELQSLLGQARVERFGEVQRLIGRGELAVQRRRVTALLENWLSVWRDLLYEGYGTAVVPTNADAAEQLPAAVMVAPAARAAGLQAIARALRAVEDNANLRMTLEGLMLELPD